MALARVPEEEVARRQDAAGQDARPPAEEIDPELRHEQDAGRRRGRRRQARRRLGDPPAVEPAEGRGSPEVERRLVRVELAEEVSDQPRAAAQHLPRGERVPRFERMPEDLVAETREVEGEAEREEQPHGRESAGRRCHAPIVPG
jgi:hypothetical protein